VRHKSKSFEKFKKFQNEVQNQLHKSIKFLQSDRGGEYLSLEFSDHLKLCGIIPQLTHGGEYLSLEFSDHTNLVRHG
jgi:hypothetical protein